MSTVITDKKTPDPVDAETLWLLQNIRPRRLRSMLEFAESEVIIPDGPYEGRKFRTRYQPYSKLWFDAVDSGHWNRYAATGPSQSGKSLSCHVIPTIYHLFEFNENVVCGLPTMDIAGDKWNEDIKPIIERTKYNQYLPKRGGGSRGGDVEAVRFANGATLRFMSGGGADKSRSAFTSRILVVTEADGLDEASKGSREADKLSQLEARTRAYGDRRRHYLECTVSIKDGCIWSEYENGTESKILLCCPYCKMHVTLERDDFTGWQDAETEFEAIKNASFHCSSCGERWSDEDIGEANKAGVLIHRGQTIDKKGKIRGKLPETKTLGFRWSAINNLFTRSADIATDEWKSARAKDEENAERKMRQFIWCLPYEPAAFETTPLESHTLARRTEKKLSRNLIPSDVEFLSAAMDVGKWMIHYTVTAWGANATGHIVDYGIIDVHSDEMPEGQAVLQALRTFRDEIMPDQWFVIEDQAMLPGRVFVDAGYLSEIIYSFCVESGERFLPSIGYGVSQERSLMPKRNYNRPAKTTNRIRLIGDGYHVAKFSDPVEVHVVEINADYWKSWLHNRLSTPITDKSGNKLAGGMSLFDAQPREHIKFSKHLTAEHQEQKYIAGKGMVTKWVRDRKQNHWLDSTYNSCVAGHLCGARLEQSKITEADPITGTELKAAFQTPDGRPYLITER